MATSLSSLAPEPKYSHPGIGYVEWSGRIGGDASYAISYQILLRRIPKTAGGIALVVTVSDKVPGVAPAIVAQALTHPEGYWLKITDSHILLVAATRQGVARALVRLSALASGAGKFRLPKGEWADWPDLRIRALHIALVHKVKLSNLERTVNMASAAEFNTLIVLVTPTGVALDSFGKLATGAALGQSQFEHFVEYARESGLQVVPGLKLLTHQEKLFGSHFPKLMFNAHTYNPADPEVYRRVFSMIDQLVKITHASAFMIGHDELAGWRPRRLPELLSLASGQKPLPAGLFIRDVDTLHAHLKQMGIQTWMWGDMLLHPQPTTPRGVRLYMHGRLPGYGPALWSKLPKDVVICDWQYAGHGTNFGSLKALHAAGFRVMGATFKNADTISAFSLYAADHGAMGMIATTWFYLPKEEWPQLRAIIKASGRSFWNAWQ